MPTTRATRSTKRKTDSAAEEPAAKKVAAKKEAKPVAVEETSADLAPNTSATDKKATADKKAVVAEIAMLGAHPIKRVAIRDVKHGLKVKTGGKVTKKAPKSAKTASKLMTIELKKLAGKKPSSVKSLVGLEETKLLVNAQARIKFPIPTPRILHLSVSLALTVTLLLKIVKKAVIKEIEAISTKGLSLKKTSRKSPVARASSPKRV